MSVPKATVDENGDPTGAKKDVGRSGETTVVQPESDPELPEFPPKRQFRRRIVPANGRHPSAGLERYRSEPPGPHSGSTPINSESPAMPTALARSCGTASPITFANRVRANGRPAG